jgi:enoyl-CoA hydratase
MAAAAIRVDRDGPVTLVRLARGRSNALDTELCREIVGQFGEIRRDGARAAVLTGAGPMFCAGVDLLRIRDGGPGYLDEFLPALTDAFLAVFGCPIPVVAAVNGHAIAGGCILVAACDHRIMNADRGRIGVTELQVGVPFPVAALEILRFAVGTQRLGELISSARTYPAADALAIGLVDETAGEAAVLDRAVEVAGGLATLPSQALAHTRRQIRRPALEAIARQRDSDKTVRALWASAEGLDAIRAFINRVLPGH